MHHNGTEPARLPQFTICSHKNHAIPFDMCPSSDQGEPLVELPPGKESGTNLTERALLLRIRQQEILAELGVFCLQGAEFADLLDRTAQLTAEGLEADYCKVMQHIPAESLLLVVAGVGWEPGVVGTATVGADLESPAGYALRTGKPVISNHLENEERFRTPELLIEHGIHRAMNVILQGDGKPFGVLEVDSRSKGEFGEHDLAFLQGAANILGMAIERQRYERHLKAALDRHQVLLKEINHRVKNSLQVVISMLQLQAKSAGDPTLSTRLTEASTRVSAIGHAYERLAYDVDTEQINLTLYLREVLKDLESAVAPCKLHFDAAPDVGLAADRAILVALIVNELVTNASKYAYPDRPGETISVSLVKDGGDAVVVTVRDEGIGLPAGVAPENSKSLGMRLVNALVTQLNARLTQPSRAAGTEFVIHIPLSRKIAAT
jgi:two-component sensor histidine kinase